MKDTYRHKGLRRLLVAELREKGIRNEDVLEAMNIIPRHFFLDKAFEEKAYQDIAFPIGNEQTISQPFTVAYQTSLLKVKNKEKILEIGTGSGYQAAILAALGARVFTLERQEALYNKSKKMLRRLGLSNVRCFFRDGFKGLPEHQYFDKILVTAGATEVPEALKIQLKIGGIMVIPVGKNIQKMYRITRLSATKFDTQSLGDFRFVPFLAGLKKKNA